MISDLLITDLSARPIARFFILMICFLFALCLINGQGIVSKLISR